MINGATVPDGPLDRAVLTDADRWILDRSDEVIAQTTDLLGDFQFGKAAEGLYHFAWDEVCDWYLELAKIQIATRRRRKPTTGRGSRRLAPCWVWCWIGCCGCCIRSFLTSPTPCGHH